MPINPSPIYPMRENSPSHNQNPKSIAIGVHHENNQNIDMHRTTIAINASKLPITMKFWTNDEEPLKCAPVTVDMPRRHAHTAKIR